jgi:hypothetical protein
MPARHETTRRVMRGLSSARVLAGLCELSAQLPAVAKSELHDGDFVVVTTQNSLYAIHVNGDGTYSVAGGWFDRNDADGCRVGINGCTFGGRAIKTDIVAAPGLSIEFDNGVTTTRVSEARLLRCASGAGAPLH